MSRRYVTFGGASPGVVGSKMGLAANRPAATGSGKMYLCTDIPIAYFDDPSSRAWQQFTGGYMPAPASASSYTLVGSIALSQYADTIRAMYLQQSVGNWAAALLSSGNLGASSAWTVTLVGSVATSISTNYPDFGVCVTNGTTSGSSTTYGIALSNDDTSINYLHAASATLGGGRGSLYVETQSGAAFYRTKDAHYRMLNDGSVLHFQFSPEGFEYQDLYSMNCPSGLTNYGFTMSGGHGAGGASNAAAFVQALVYSNNLGIPQQWSVTGATNASPSVISISGTNTIQVGDMIACHGSNGNTGISTSSGNYFGGGGLLVTAVSGQTITTTANGNGTWTSGGTITLLSR